MTNATDLRPRSYAEAADLLGSHDARKIGHNTTLQRLDSETIGIMFHGTYIVKFHSNWITAIYSGGYRTVTTKERINRYLPNGHRLYQDKYEWFVRVPHRDAPGTFVEGYTVFGNGTGVPDGECPTCYTRPGEPEGHAEWCSQQQEAAQ